jgi:hypothetical protein
VSGSARDGSGREEESCCFIGGRRSGSCRDKMASFKKREREIFDVSVLSVLIYLHNGDITFLILQSAPEEP